MGLYNSNRRRYSRINTNMATPPTSQSHAGTNPANKMGISAFRSLYKDGFARANRYQVMVGGYNTYPESITLPSRSVSVYTHSLFGPTIQYPYREIFNDNIVLTYTESAFGVIRRDAEWSGIGRLVSLGRANPASIDTTVNNMMIKQLDYADNEIGTYYIFGAYIISIVPTNMGYAMNNETTKVQIMVKYYRYNYI